MQWDNIPEELKQNGLWCCWKIGNKGKIPYDIVKGGFAKSNDKNTFYSFNTALEHIHEYIGYDAEGKQTGGLGLGIFNGYSAIDIDHCRDEKGLLSDIAQDIIGFCKSYTEISPSGNGIRIIFKTNSELNNEYYYINNRKIGVEIYLSDQTNKFVTVTGNIQDYKDIREIDINYILQKYMKKATSDSSDKLVLTEFDINQYKSDSKLLELWNKKAPGSNADESETDLALCNKLAFYLKGDFIAIKNAFVSSPYYKSKDSAHIKKWERSDYSEVTIKKAILSYFDSSNLFDNFGLTDTGNAHLFVSKFNNIVRYNIDNNMWMIWNSINWQHDVFGNIKNLAEIVIEEMKRQAKMAEDENIRKAMFQNVKRALQSGGKIAMLKEAEHLEGIPVTNESFDNDPFIFNCKSGIIDLKTGKIEPHNKDKMCAQYSPYEVDYSEPKLWIKFLNEIFEEDKEVIKYVQRVLGYAMTGSAREQCMFMLIGDGSNGKSLLLDVFNKACGTYGATSNVDILLEKHTQTAGNLGDIARLNQKRSVITDEARLGDRLNESAIKTMTSGIGKIVARFLYGNEFEFTFIAKIFMASNYKPVIRGTDHGIWRRIKLIPFNVVIPDEEQDKDLPEKLYKEIPQILGWLIKGCIEWQKHGLKEPRQLADSTREYKSEMDIVQKWVDETCEIGANCKEKSSKLFDNFSNYVKANKEYQLSHTMFGRNMSKKFRKRVIGGVVYYMGVKLKTGNEYMIDKKTYDDI